MNISAGEFSYPSIEAVIFGRPAGDAVVECMARAGGRRAFVVSGRSLAALSDGPLQRVLKRLGECCVGVHTSIRAHTPREDVLAAAEAARSAGADILVGVGGGSVIDAVKAMQLCLWLELRGVDDFERVRVGSATLGPIELPVDPIRAISVSTTLSAAEFTSLAGVTHTQTRTKQMFKHPLLVPRFVVLDPASLAHTPAALLFATAVRSIDHAVETYLSPSANPATEALSLQGLHLLATSLWRMPGDPHDPSLNMRAQFGMWQAIAAAVAGVPTGASHGIGYALGAGFDVGHGETSCVILPAVVDWTARTDAFGAVALADALERPGRPVGASLRELIAHLRLPTTLGAVGVEPSSHRELATRALTYPSLLLSRRPVTTLEQVLEILALAS